MKTLALILLLLIAALLATGYTDAWRNPSRALRDYVHSTNWRGRQRRPGTPPLIIGYDRRV